MGISLEHAKEWIKDSLNQMPDASPSLAGTAVYAHVSNYQSCNRQK